MKKLVLLENLIPSLSLSLSYTDGSTQVTVLTSEQAKSILNTRFYDYCFLGTYNNSLTEDENIQAIIAEINATWTAWKGINAPNFDKLFLALSRDYDPTNNYLREESGEVTDAHHRGMKRSQNRNEVNTPRTTERNDYYANGINGTDGQKVGHDTHAVISGESTYSASADTNYIKYEDISGTVYDKDVRTFDSYKISGNIGLLSMSDMVQKEIDLRLNSWALILLEKFIRNFFLYVSGIEFTEGGVECD